MIKENETRFAAGPAPATQSSGVLGPFPATAIAVLDDLGLTDQEIADYFRVDPQRIARLRETRMPELLSVCTGDLP
jgi:hypothetical protein